MFKKVDGFIVVVVAFTLIALVGGVFAASRMGKSKVEMNEQVLAATDETSYDWGEIGINGGNVEKTFEIKNEGSEVLKLSDVVTSCMCTTARLSLGDDVSPEFGMHDKSSYIMEVAPGKAAQLTVTFDPAYHGPSGVGPITRQIEVHTNDPENPVLNYMLSAVVRS